MGASTVLVASHYTYLMSRIIAIYPASMMV